MAADRSGQSVAVLAMSEMGKGVWLKQHLKAASPAKLIIWDMVNEYGRLAAEAKTFAALAGVIHSTRPSYAVRYVPKAKTSKKLRAEFETFCTIAYDAVGASIVVEELADVTSASWAPPAWRQLNTRGRHHQGLTLYWCSQSPAWVDKASMGNATHLHVGYLGEPAHRKAAAAHMACKPEQIDALKQFEFMEYSKAEKLLTYGKVKLPRSRPDAKTPRVP